MKLYNRQWTRRELEARVGRLEQIAGVRRMQWAEGPEAGVEHIQVRTGAGLEYTVIPGRGLDISLLTFGGAPLTWQSANGEAHPAYFEPRELEWLRTAAGGLLMTCGLTQVGSPNVDGQEHLGLHGRAHHIPARQVVAEGRWEGDAYEMRVAGVIDETRIFGHHLRLRREIRSRLGENRLSIQDVVENVGFEPAPHMILYHFNFGFPLLSEDTEIQFPSQQVRAREPETPVEDLGRWQKPQPGYQERVYYHSDFITRDGWATTSIYNPSFPLANGAAAVPLRVELSWESATLPQLIQWRMPGAGVHVLGIEPANCLVEGRSKERERGTLVVLQPGESRQYELVLSLEIP